MTTEAEAINAARIALAQADARPEGATIRPGTVLAAEAVRSTATVRLDGDDQPVYVQSLVGVAAIGSRVMVLLTAPHGALILGTLGSRSDDAPLSQQHLGSIANGTATGSMTAFYTANAILVAPFPLVMWVQVSGDLGANAAVNTCHIDISDEAGTGIYPTGALVGNVVVIKQTIGNDGKTFALQAQKAYAAGATCGFRLRYRVDASNIYIAAVAKVSFERQ